MKVLHIADAHLRDAQYGNVGRRADFNRALMGAVELAELYKLPAILMAGDMLDQKRPSPQLIDFMKLLNHRLRDAGIKMLVVAGNHDQTEVPWWSLARDFGQGDEGIIALQNELYTLHQGNDHLTVYGANPLYASNMAELQERCPAADILLAHAMVEEFCPFPQSGSIPLAAFDSLPIRVALLGDIHLTDVKNTAKGVQVAYPGSLELCEKSEPADKHALLWDIPSAGSPSYSVLNIPTRRVLKYALHTEEELAVAVSELHQYKKDKPLVFVEYRVGLENAKSRLLAAVDQETTLLRMTPLPDMSGKWVSDEVNMDTRPITSFLEEFIPADSPAHKLARRLLNPEADPKAEIKEYVAEKLGGVHAN